MNWTHSMISGAYLAASFIVIMFKKDEMLRATRAPVSCPTPIFDVVRRTNTTLNVLQEGRWTGLTQFTLLNNTPTSRIHVVRGGD